VRILFIGESPPASGRFFYNRDSGLYRAIRDLFSAADPSITDENFLSIFQASGCYLIDACSSPVDDMDRNSRRAACVSAEPLLARKINQLQPETIVSLVRSISGNIERAILRAQWHGPLLDVPYPGRWVQHRKTFTAELLPQVKAVLSLA
jgi:hypothetical protein